MHIGQGRGAARNDGRYSPVDHCKNQRQGSPICTRQRRVLQHDQCADRRRIQFEIEARSIWFDGSSGSEIGGAGLIGQNFLEQWDVEYDFSKGVARLFKPEGCRKYRLAYWLTPGQSFSVTDIESLKQARMQTIGEGYVNGHRIRVTFDSGAYTSVLSLRAAARAGIKTDSPGVVEAGYGSGIGRSLVKTYIATASSFKIGDSEEIKNARLRIQDLDLVDTDMLLGSDFFVSHHIFVANSQRKLYLTYNGGPVFNLTKTPSATAAQAAEAPKDETTKDEAARDHQAGAAADEQLD